MPMHDVKQLEMTQRNTSIHVPFSAFSNYTMWTTLFPDDVERDRMMPVLWQGVVAYCQAFGRVDTIGDIAGVAAWAKPGYAHLTLWRHLRSGFVLFRAVLMLSAKSRALFLRAMSQTDRAHARWIPSPHWYLWALGVDPNRQGSGIGSRLLMSGVLQAQQAGRPCFLETNTEANVDFYQKRGFEVLHEERFANVDLRQWLMVRPVSRSV